MNCGLCAYWTGEQCRIVHIENFDDWMLMANAKADLVPLNQRPGDCGHYERKANLVWRILYRIGLL
jgi:hypothetical protein